MLRLCDIMTTDVLTVSPETPLRAAMELLSARHISGVPVVAGRRVVGVISASDIVTFATGEQRLPAEPPAMPDDGEWEAGESPPAAALRALWDGSSETGYDDAGGGASEPPAAPSRGLDPLSESTVADAMTWGVYGLAPDTDVMRAAECMRAAEVHRMLVMDEGRLLGIVTTMDLLRAVARGELVSAQ